MKPRSAEQADGVHEKRRHRVKRVAVMVILVDVVVVKRGAEVLPGSQHVPEDRVDHIFIPAVMPESIPVLCPVDVGGQQHQDINQTQDQQNSQGPFLPGTEIPQAGKEPVLFPQPVCTELFPVRAPKDQRAAEGNKGKPEDLRKQVPGDE